MAFSVDAAQLSDKTSHIYGGCKHVDIWSRDKDGNLQYVYEEHGVCKYINLQSNANVYLMIMVYTKDRKNCTVISSKSGLNLLIKLRQKLYLTEMKQTQQ